MNKWSIYDTVLSPIKMERAIRGPQKLICAIYGSSSNVENPSPLSPYAGDAVALLG
jgi:hypothetical protein